MNHHPKNTNPLQKITLLLCALVLSLGTTLAHAIDITATWVGTAGGGDGLNWSDGLNWDTGGDPPCNTGPLFFSIVIPAGNTVQCDVTGSCTVTNLTLNDNATLRLMPGTDLTVLLAADIFGIIDGQGGNFTATGPGAAFPGNRARLCANNGSVITVWATSYSSAGLPFSATILCADGVGSQLNLPLVTSVSTAFNTGCCANFQVHTITATNGGVIDLSAVDTVTPPARGDDAMQFVLSDDLSSINLNGLQTMSGAGGYSNFVLSNSAVQNLPSVTTLGDTRFILTSGAQLHVNGLQPVSYTSSGIWWTNTIMSASGVSADGLTPTLLDLSAVTSVSTAFNTGCCASVQAHSISVANGGTINLSGINKLITPARSEDRIDCNLSGGGILDMPNLGMINGAGRCHITLSAGAILTVGDLNTTSVMTITLNDPLTTLNMGSFVASAGPGASITINDPAAHLNVAGTLQLDSNISLTAPTGALVNIGGNLPYGHTLENSMLVSRSEVHLDGSGTIDSPQGLEIGGLNVECFVSFLGDDNFAIGRLIIGQPGQPTVVQLQDCLNNGNRGGGVEALYLFGQPGKPALDGLDLLAGSTLILNNFDVYVFEGGIDAPVNCIHLNALFSPGVNEVPFEGGTLRMLPSCPADIAPCGLGNNLVNIDDLVALLNAFGPCPTSHASCPADITPPGGNNTVNIDDLVAILNAFGPCP